jgi:hypothetical protein
LARLDKDVLTKPGVRTVLLLEGINDIYAGATIEELMAGYRQLIAQVHASGRCIVGGRLTGTVVEATSLHHQVSAYLRPWLAMASSYSWRIASAPDFL